MLDAYDETFTDQSNRSLREVTQIAKKQVKRGLVVRVIYNMTDAGRIRQAREKINAAVARFQVYGLICLVSRSAPPKHPFRFFPT